MPTLDVPGASLYYETDGHISAPAVLLIHAGVATLRMWDPIVDRLAADHFIIRLDTRGFGLTTTSDVEFSDSQDARDLLDHLGIQRATVVGCSRGGRIAIDLTVETPERVSGLVTIGSGPGGFPDTELTETEDALFDALDEAYRAADWQRLSRLTVELWTFGPTRSNEDLDPAFVELAYALNEPNIAHGHEKPTAIPVEPPAYDRVVDIEIPVLATVGEFDLSEALAQHAFLIDTIPSAEGYIFSDTAHLPSVENPAEFGDVLIEWMVRHGL